MSFNINPVFHEIEEGAGYLTSKLGFTMEEEMYSPANFGNAYVILSNKDMRIRVITDRGGPFLDVGPLGLRDIWWDLPIVRAFLEAQDVQDTRNTGLTRFEDDAAYLRDHYDEIKRLLRRDVLPETEQALDALRRKRIEARIPGLFQ